MENNEDIPLTAGAKYNSGIDKIYTMSTIRKGCHDFKITRDLSSWYQCLRSWRSEMNAKFDDDEKIKCETYHKFFESYLYKRKSQRYFILEDNKIDLETLNDYEIDNYLYEYELYLGDLAEKYKFGMPDAEDDEGL